MLNVLPFEVKKKLRQEYLMRLSAFGLALASLAGLLAAAMLVPALIYAKSERSGYEIIIGNIEGVDGKEDVFETVRAVKEKITFLKSGVASPILPLFKKVVDAKRNGIVISGISFTRNNAVVIEGVASTRAALVAYRDTITAISDFSSVQLPISELAKSSNIEFTLNASLKK
jgi:hypothetical protein